MLIYEYEYVRTRTRVEKRKKECLVDTFAKMIMIVILFS